VIAVLSLLLRCLSILGVLVAANAVAPSTVWGYEAQSRPSTAYDGASLCAFDYDSASALAICEKQNGATGNRVPFAEFAGFDAAKGGGQSFEILDGVRRAKANQLLGNQTVPANIFNAEGKLVGQGNIAVDALRSPNKSVIDMSTQTDVNRYMRIQNGLQQGNTLPPINVTPGSRGVRIEDIIFDATGGSR
jgi:hypothetical protein